LRLVRSKADLDVLVIDKAEKVTHRELSPGFDSSPLNYSCRFIPRKKVKNYSGLRREEK